MTTSQAGLDPAAVETACKNVWESRENYPRQWENVNPETALALRNRMIQYTTAYLTATATHQEQS